MKKMLVFSVVAVFAFSSLATAQIDPYADGMGIYFDAGATTFCTDYVDGVVTVAAYLVVTNQSTLLPAVLAWEANLHVDTDAFLGGGAWTLAQEFDLNVGSGDNFQVGTTNPPLAFTGTATVLATHALTFIGNGGTYGTYTIGRVEGSIGSHEGALYTSQVGIDIACQHIFGAWGTPSAWVNGAENCDTIANEDMTWGSVKSLY